MKSLAQRTVIAAWGAMLLASLLPNIIGQEVLGQALPWLAIKSGLLAALLVAGLVLPWLKPLRPYLVILLLIRPTGRNRRARGAQQGCRT